MRDDFFVRLVTALETIAVNTTPAESGTTTEPPAESTGESKSTKGGTK